MNDLESAGILSIDGQGGKNGILNIGYAPCTMEGDCNEENLWEDRILCQLIDQS